MVKVAYRIGMGVLVIALLINIRSVKVLAAPNRQTAPNSLYVNGALIDLQNATPGQVYEHEMTVGIGPEAPAIQVRISARGFGQDTDGAFIPLSEDQDQSPYSARTFISQITPAEFRLEPGASVVVKVTLNLPEDLGIDTRYAIIFIDTLPDQSAGQVGQILTASVPVIVTPALAQSDLSGEITSVTVPEVVSGQPIEIQTTVQNNGNRHYKVQGLVTIFGPSGQPLADIPIQNTPISIIPAFSQQIRTIYSAIDRSQGLPPGTYSAQVSLTRDDGSPLGSEKTKFEIKEAFLPFPGIDPDSLVIECYQDEVPQTINAFEKTDVAISFENMEKGTGCIAIGKYSQAPDMQPQFSSSVEEGGMGGEPIKHVAVQVDGFNSGVAHITVRYRPDEITNVVANSLLLAYRDTASWHKLDNLTVQTGAEVVLGDLQVAMLIKGKEIAIGGESTGQAKGNSIYLPWIATTGVLLIAVIAGTFYWRSRNNNHKEK